MDIKNYSQPKSWELCFIRWEFLGLQTWETASPVTQRELTTPRRRGEEPGYIEVLQQRAGSLNIKRLLLLKENQISQVKEFSAFLCMGKCKSLGSVKSFLWYVPQLSGASFLRFHILSFLRVHHGEWLQPDGCQMADILSILSSLRAQQLTIHGGCNCWWLWHPCLLVWQEIFRFSDRPLFSFPTQTLGQLSLMKKRVCPGPRAFSDHPLQFSCLENPMDRGAWQTLAHRIAVGHDWSDWVSTARSTA